MRFLVISLCALILCGAAWAEDSKVQLEFEELPCLQSGAAITEAAPVAVSSADKYTDGVLIGGGIDSTGKQFTGRLYLGIYYDVDLGTATSVGIKIQVSKDNSTWVDVLPSNQFTITADQVAVRAVSIPPCKYIRVHFVKDGSDGTWDVDICRIWRL